MSDVLLALWIALIGADRIDFAGGNGPFIVTPYLALTPIVIVSEIWRHWSQRRPVVVSRYAMGYALAAAALGGVALISVLFAVQVPISASRTILLILDMAGTFAVALLCADRRGLMRTLAFGAIGCLALFAAFDVAEVLWYIGRGPELIRIGTVVGQFHGLQTAGPLPRLAGPVNDANRGAFVLVFYMVVFAGADLRPAVKRLSMALAFIFLALTFSRSGFLTALATLVVAVLTSRQSISPRVALASTAGAALLALFVLTHPNTFDQIGAVLQSPAASRLSANEGSAQSHVALIIRGLDEATQSVKRAALGLGYGDSFLVLQDVFPGSRYGNFHSLYVTMFAEAGILALILTLVMMGAPLVAGGPWRSMIAGAFAFNVFYQTTTEPVFWFLLACAWLTMPPGAWAPGAWSWRRHEPRPPTPLPLAPAPERR